MSPFHALYERYATDVYRFALYLAGNQAQIEWIQRRMRAPVGCNLLLGVIRRPQPRQAD